MDNQVVWFDIPATDLDRAMRFYSAVLGVTEPLKRQGVGEDAMAVLPHTDETVSGCLCTGKNAKPGATGPLLYLNCQGRLDAAIAVVEKNGGSVLQPKHPIGPYG